MMRAVDVTSERECMYSCNELRASKNRTIHYQRIFDFKYSDLLSLIYIFLLRYISGVGRFFAKGAHSSLATPSPTSYSSKD